MNAPTGNRRDQITRLVAAAAFLCAVAFGLIERWQFIGSLNDLGHQFVTGVTVVGVDNWMQDGFFNDKGTHVEIPASIEFRGIHDRSIYVSYPPGALIEIFLLKKLTGVSDTTTLAQLFGVANQVAIALLCYLTVMSFAFRVDRTPRRIVATGSAILYLLLPIPYYWHSTVFFVDEAVILPFAAAIYLEALIRTKPQSWHYWLQSAILSAMAYIDWLILPFAAILFVFRLLSPVEKHSSSRNAFVANGVQIFLGPAIAISIHLTIVILLRATPALIERFFFRTGVSESGASYVKNFFQQFFVEYLGIWNTVLIALTAIFFLVRSAMNRRDQVAALANIGILACLLQVFLLRNHSVNHSFSALKFIFPLCYATFGLLPLAVLEFFAQRDSNKTQHEDFPRPGSGMHFQTSRLIAGLMGLIVAVYFLVQRASWQDLFPPKVLTNGEIARWLRQNARYNDVFVSTDVSIDKYPPQVMAIARKFIWKLDSAPALRFFVPSLPAGATIHLVRDGEKGGCDETTVGERIAMVGKYSIVRVRSNLAVLETCMYPAAVP